MKLDNYADVDEITKDLSIKEIIVTAKDGTLISWLKDNFYENEAYNLQYVMETQDTRTYGLWMAKPLLGYLQVSNTLEPNYKIIPYSSFNTCAYMTYGFKDFGYWLSVLMSIFLGYFVKRVYSRYRMSRSPYDVAAYILVAQATLEMFFSNHFFTQSYPFTIVILMAAIKWIMRQRNALPELESNNKA